MKMTKILSFLIVAISSTGFALDEIQEREKPAVNDQIDFAAFLKLSQEVAPYREKRRVSLKDFSRMAEEEDTIILDTRSRKKYEMKHIKGAIHLNFSDFTEESLRRTIPSKKTRVLIYCNNNFRDNGLAFPLKSAPAALNIPTFITLYQYGYRNLYELAPVINESDPRIQLAPFHFQK